MQDNDIRRGLTGAVLIGLLLGGPGIVGWLGWPWPLSIAAMIGVAWLVFGAKVPSASHE